MGAKRLEEGLPFLLRTNILCGLLVAVSCVCLCHTLSTQTGGGLGACYDSKDPGG